MENNKYKVLVLLDLKENTNDVLNYSTELLKEIDADIEFFSVKKPTEVVYTDSQLSAIRNINSDFVSTDRKIKKMISPFLNQVSTSVKTSLSFGNVKNEIAYKIQSANPDIVILGYRKQKTFNLLGDGITNFVYRTHQGTTLVASGTNEYNSISVIKNAENHLRKELVS